MSIRNFINATREGNAASAEEAFQTVVSEKLGNRLGAMRAEVVSGMFGLSEEVIEITEQKVDDYLDSLSEEELDRLESLSEEEAANIIESDIRRYAKMGVKLDAASETATGAARKGVRGTANLVRRVRNKPISKSPGSA